MKLERADYDGHENITAMGRPFTGKYIIKCTEEELIQFYSEMYRPDFIPIGKYQKLLIKLIEDELEKTGIVKLPFAEIRKRKLKDVGRKIKNETRTKDR